MTNWDMELSLRPQNITCVKLGPILLYYPLQCSCLENPRDSGAWWAAVHGVAEVGHD